VRCAHAHGSRTGHAVARTAATRLNAHPPPPPIPFYIKCGDDTSADAHRTNAPARGGHQC
jgi:hypothetical protein